MAGSDGRVRAGRDSVRDAHQDAQGLRPVHAPEPHQRMIHPRMINPRMIHPRMIYSVEHLHSSQHEREGLSVSHRWQAVRVSEGVNEWECQINPCFTTSPTHAGVPRL